MSSPPESWRIILFTDYPLAAQWAKGFLAAQGHRLVAAVTSSKRASDFPYLTVVDALQPEIDVLVSTRPRHWAAQLAPLRPDLIVSMVFPHKLPPDLLVLPRLGAVNIHPTLLPRYRGTDIPYWLLRNGERETGLTLHRMAAQFDVGPILAQTAVPIDDDDTIEHLLTKLAGSLGTMWAQALPRIAAGDPGDPQDEVQASYYGHIADEVAWKTIDWTRPAREVHNVVRSSAFPRTLPPGAVGLLDGVPHRITLTRLLPGVSGAGTPGTSTRRASDLLVQCGDGPLAVLAYEPA